MLVSMKRELKMEDDNSKVIVCSPLIALMIDQCEKLNCIPGIRAVHKGGSPDDDNDIDNGNFQYLFSSPEILVGDKAFRAKLQHHEVSTIVVDEVHTISTWCENEEEGKQAFRKWFSHIGELRSLFPAASVLALSATCTKKISKRMGKILQLDQSTTEIRISPNKPNIKLMVHKIPNTIEMAMVWLVDAVKDNKLPRTIIYCNSIKDASNLYTYLISEIPDCTNIEMFHSETPVECKEKVLQALKNGQSEITVVIATSALGMGVDIVDFSNVILYGAPKNMIDLVQEIGRVGRDGSQSIALLLYNSYHLRNIDTEVKEYCKTSNCRRLSLLAPFLTVQELEKEKKNTGKHSCCDLCNANCECGFCVSTDLEKLLHVSDSLEEPGDQDTSSDDTEPYDVFDYEDSIDSSLILDLDLQ